MGCLAEGLLRFRVVDQIIGTTTHRVANLGPVGLRVVKRLLRALRLIVEVVFLKDQL